MKILIIICSIIVLGVVLKSILDEEKYKKLYNDMKDEKDYLQDKLDTIEEILKQDDKIAIYNRNTYRTIRLIKEEMK